MMRELAILAIFGGWLCAELKDFFINGGVNNTLAFSLLKIMFILMMIIVFGAIATSHPILATIRRIANFLDIPYDNDDTPQPPERLPQLKPK